MWAKILLLLSILQIQGTSAQDYGSDGFSTIWIFYIFIAVVALGAKITFWICVCRRYQNRSQQQGAPLIVTGQQNIAFTGPEQYPGPSFSSYPPPPPYSAPSAQPPTDGSSPPYLARPANDGSNPPHLVQPPSDGSNPPYPVQPPTNTSNPPYLVQPSNNGNKPYPVQPAYSGYSPPYPDVSPPV